jgi:hypothetical protein
MRSDERAADLSLEEDRIEDLEPEDGELAEGVKGGRLFKPIGRDIHTVGLIGVPDEGGEFTAL